MHAWNKNSVKYYIILPLYENCYGLWPDKKEVACDRGIIKTVI
jgi:hypothetical protein